jgi:putative acetyltransferase
MEINIRKFKTEDTAALLALFYDTVHTVNAKHYPTDQLDAWAPQLPDMKRWSQRFKSSETLIAEIEGIVVGFGNLESGNTIGMLYVHKDYQGKGVAATLLRKLEKKLIKLGSKSASAEVSITARPFFEKRGYQIIRENRKMLNGKEFLNYVMEKQLVYDTPIENNESPRDYGAGKKKRIHWGELLTNKVFDLIIVILGISIAFQLNNLKLENDKRILERFNYESLISDIEEDITDINVIVGDLGRDRQLASRYLKSIEAGTANPDSLGIVIGNLMSLESFPGNQDTYLTLVSGSGLSNITNPEIRRQITEYYGHYAYVNRFERVHTELILEFYKYVSPHLDILNQRVTDPALVKDIQTKNYLVIFVSNLNSGIEDYQDALKQAEDLRAAIKLTLSN